MINLENSEVLSRFNVEYLKQQNEDYQWCKTADMPFKLTGHLEAKTYEELPRNSQWGIERNDYQNDQRKAEMEVSIIL